MSKRVHKIQKSKRNKTLEVWTVYCWTQFIPFHTTDDNGEFLRAVCVSRSRLRLNGYSLHEHKSYRLFCMNKVAAAKSMVRKLTIPHRERSPVILRIGL